MVISAALASMCIAALMVVLEVSDTFFTETNVYMTTTVVPHLYLLDVVLHCDAAEGDGQDPGHVEDLRCVRQCSSPAHL
jgi:hypothetical protein